MSIVATTNSQPKELIPAGNYIARCYQMIQIGHVKEVILGEVKTLNKVRIGWELPTETKVFNPEKGEQPFVISEEYTLSMHEKSNLRKVLASWRGKDFSVEEAGSFDITKLLGVPCMLNIIHRPGKSDPSRMYQKIGSVSPLAKGVVCPAQINQTTVLQYDNFDHNLFASLPDFIKDKIKNSEEFIKMQSPAQAIFSNNDSDPDDLPF
jgi:hypothetical protein